MICGTFFLVLDFLMNLGRFQAFFLHYFGLRKTVVLDRACSVFYAAKFKKVKNTGDLTYSLYDCVLTPRKLPIILAILLHKIPTTRNFLQMTVMWYIFLGSNLLFLSYHGIFLCLSTFKTCCSFKI